MFGSEKGQNNFTPQDFNPDELFRQMFQGQGLDEILKQAFAHQRRGNQMRDPMADLLGSMMGGMMSGGMRGTNGGP